jgi:Zn-finger nucleic acid-binding protein
MNAPHPAGDAPRGAGLHRLAACAACGRQFDFGAGGEHAGRGPGDSFACSCGARVEIPVGRPEDAAVVACSACGAPRQGQAESCSFCGSTFTLRELDLDAICPRCFARVSRRGRFCHHCATPLTAPRAAGTPTAHGCPACPPAAEGGSERRRPLVSRRIGAGDPLHLFECRVCGGVWLDREVFGVLVERVKHGRGGLPAPRAAAAGTAAAEAARGWTYRPCAVCGHLMNRRNYARRSGVILDLCGDHGLWFDADELHRVLAWVRGGGVTEAEARAAEAARPRPPAGGMVAGPDGSWLDTADRGSWVLDGLLVVARVAGELFERALRR